ncbi:MAG TPA: aconitate hydratase AcnA [Anaerolineales bacterium]|nr:aconitate hydratase AcnA [Anaerolineales bacterium]
MPIDAFAARRALPTRAGEVIIFRLAALEQAGLTRLDRLPFSIRILLESVLRQVDERVIRSDDVRAAASWAPRLDPRPEVPFLPARVLMQDFTGVPAVVDLAAMRSALARLGADPARINPTVPVDLVIDHSVQVDFFASPEALQRNADLEFQRNQERYRFLRWGQEAFDNFRVVPPATGIVHQVNLEYLARVVQRRITGDGMLAFPDSLVGTDSHTTMINGLGVLGWGVGGIEAEAAMLGQPMVLSLPQVVGVRLSGRLGPGSTATDLTLTITQRLRQHGVIDKFVEFFGPGLDHLSLPDRATIANMAPEYGATIGFFPVDDETLRYLRLTGREDDLIDLVERYCKEQQLFRTSDSPEPAYGETLEIDLDRIEPSVAGPKRPQDRVPLSQVATVLRQTLTAETRQGGFAVPPDRLDLRLSFGTNGSTAELGHGSVVIAAITSCTNTSNPSVMVAAGLLARKAVERGLRVPPYVKTSLAPGSRVVTDYLGQAGLLQPLAQLGFNVVGYGCTTCIGNSGPLAGEVVKAITEGELVAAAVLSGNRNFEGRIQPHVRASYLASPPLVVAYALAGTMAIDLTRDPLGKAADGAPVHLRDLWPTPEEVEAVIRHEITPSIFRNRYAEVFTGNPTWNAIPVSAGELYPWDPDSTYIQEPPFFPEWSDEPPPVSDVVGARVLVLLGDSVTTDHISPAGTIPADAPAGRYLIEHGVAPRDFNSYGARRGNDRVMTRGTFANIRLKNLLVPGVEGGVTVHFPSGETMRIYEAAMRYRQAGVPLVVVAGREYGAGSSRDWAAKGTLLLGVRAVLAASYERIHRSNLVGMGVLPLQFTDDQEASSIGLQGNEIFALRGLVEAMRPGAKIEVAAERPDGTRVTFPARVRLDTPSEVEFYRNGGILHSVLRQILRERSR